MTGVWISIRDLRQIWGLSNAQIHRYAAAGRFDGQAVEVRQVRGRGGLRYEFLVSSLPLWVQARIYRAEGKAEGQAGATCVSPVRAEGHAEGQAGATCVSPVRERARGDGKAKGKRGASRTAIDAAAWEAIKADYLRPEAPALRAVYERVSRRFDLPSYKTVLRRVEELPLTVRVLAREGDEALTRMYPAQVRDKSVFRPMEAVNADGHKFDVFVRWPDGEIGRPVMAAWQDIYSAKLLSRRVAKTENADTIRLSFGDAIDKYGIPSRAYLDNGRGFASKWLTGGMKTRFRFKVKAEEPAGILTKLGVDVHWCTPYHGQSKPIERAFRDLCEYVAKHPAFSGAYTGNNPTAKPENYGDRAVPLAVFMAVLNEEIAAHNARTGRRSAVCAGRSFDEAFFEGQPQGRPVQEHERLFCLLAAEGVRGSRESGEILLGKNRYWCEALVEHRGEALTVRFDPDNLHAPVWVYSLSGDFIARADCIAATGFADTQAAREHARARNHFKKAQREQLKAMRDMSVLEATIPNVSVDEPGKIHILIDGAPAEGPAEGPAERAPCEAPVRRDPEEAADQAIFNRGISDYLKRIAAERAAEEGLADGGVQGVGATSGSPVPIFPWKFTGVGVGN